MIDLCAAGAAGQRVCACCRPDPRIAPLVCLGLYLPQVLDHSTGIVSGWQHIPAGLEHLSARDCVVDVLPAAALPQLEKLDLTGAVVRQDCWEQLAGATALQQLGLGSCRGLGSELPAALSSLQALTRLELSHQTNLSSGWQHLSALAPHLRYLALVGCFGFGDFSGPNEPPLWQPLTHHSQLFPSPPVDPEAELPAVLGSLTNLHTLDLATCPAAAKAGQLALLARLCSSLHVLSLRE